MNKKKFSGMIYVVIFIVFLMWNRMMPWHEKDDIFFSSIPIGNIPSVVRERYYQWSSRMIIDAATIFMTQVPWFIWIIVESLVMVLLVRMITVLTGNKENGWKMPLGMMVLLLTVNLTVFVSAGTVATAMNYIWTSAFLCVGILPLWQAGHGEKTKLWQKICMSAAVLYAADMEVTAALLFGYYVIYFLFLRKKGEKNLYLLFNFILICVSLVIILSCPGNKVRTLQETTKWLPAFAHYTFGDKVGTGWLTFTSYYLTAEDHCIALFFFSFALGLISMKRNGHKSAFIPFLMALISRITAFIANHYTSSLSENAYAFLHLHQNTSLVSPYIGFELIYSFIVFGMLAFLLAELTDNFKKKMVIVLVYLSAIMSKVILGFSPTVYGSGSRTTLFCTFILYALVLWMTGKYLSHQKS